MCLHRDQYQTWVQKQKNNRFVCASNLGAICAYLPVKFIQTVSLSFSVWPFKSPVPAVAGALVNLNAHCSKMFTFSNTKDIHLMRDHCPSHPLKADSLH